jgi:hypothetical protein
MILTGCQISGSRSLGGGSARGGLKERPEQPRKQQLPAGLFLPSCLPYSVMRAFG